MELNLENDLILDYILQLHMFENEHLFLVNRIVPIKYEDEKKMFSEQIHSVPSIRLPVVWYH